MIEAVDVTMKLNLLLKDLRTDRACLAAADAGAEMAETDALIKDCEEAQALIAGRAGQRREEKERHRKWEEILPRCAEAREAFENAALAVKTHNEKEAELVDAWNRTERRLGDCLLAEPPAETYPSAKTLARWRAERDRLVREVEQRKGALKAHREKQSSVAVSYQNAREKFERLAREEMSLRPKGEFPKIVPTDFRLVRERELTGVPPQRELSGVR